MLQGPVLMQFNRGNVANRNNVASSRNDVARTTFYVVYHKREIGTKSPAQRISPSIICAYYEHWQCHAMAEAKNIGK